MKTTKIQRKKHYSLLIMLSESPRTLSHGVATENLNDIMKVKMIQRRGGEFNEEMESFPKKSKI